MKKLLVSVRIALFVATLSASSVASRAAEPLHLFVSSVGNDGWTGHSPERKSGGVDGPLATLVKARDTIRAAKAAGGLAGGAVVTVRGGTYFLDDTLVLGPADSGTADAPVVYEAYAAEKPIISGGVPLRNWKTNAAGQWQTTLPRAGEKPWAFAQLFVNDARRYRPRWPREGYAYIASSLPPSPKNVGKGYDRFQFKPGDIRETWRNRNDLEVLVFQQWGMLRMRVAELDTAASIVRFTGATKSVEDFASMHSGWRYLVENVAEELKDPGQWYFDRQLNTVTYVPMKGETPSTTEVVAPRLPVLVQLQGDPERGKFVEHVTFRGLSFRHSNWEVPEAGFVPGQADTAVGGAIVGTGARDILIDRCEVSRIGTYAIEFGLGCSSNRVQSCDLLDLGAGGVLIGTKTVPQQKELIAHDNIVDDCVIAGGGRVHPAGVGVWIGQAAHNTVSHNEITNLYYSGISAGWTWNYSATGTRDNQILSNRIHNIGQDVLSDMGGIYTLGVSTGTLVKGNVIYDLNCYRYGAWALYTDQASSGIRFEDNLCYDSESGVLHQHWGKENEFVNNIFVFGPNLGLVNSRAEPHLSMTLKHNVIVWNDAGSPLRGKWQQGPTGVALDENLYWNGGKSPVRFGTKTFEQWQSSGQDVKSVIADPRFADERDPEAAQWRLAAGSPAEKVGFKSFDVTTAGTKRPAPQFPPAFPVFPGQPPEQPMREDFESSAVGDIPSLASISEGKTKVAATIRVTDAVAARGKQSLKFTAAPGQRPGNTPRMQYEPHLTNGMVAERFAFRLEDGAEFWHEWRTGDSPFKVGPSFRIQANGDVVVDGRTLMNVPKQKWVTIEISCGVGTAADGKWSLTIKPMGGGAGKTFDNLAADPGFYSADWIGFIFSSADPGTFYIDDFQIGHPRSK